MLFSSPARKVDSTGQAEICLAERFSVMQGENCPPTTATYWPISVPLGSWHSILHCAGTSFFSTTIFISLANGTQMQTHKYSCTISLTLSCHEANV